MKLVKDFHSFLLCVLEHKYFVFVITHGILIEDNGDETPGITIVTSFRASDRIYLLKYQSLGNLASSQCLKLTSYVMLPIGKQNK